MNSDATVILIVVISLLLNVYLVTDQWFNESPAQEQYEQCQADLAATSAALTHKINGSSLLTVGSVCVIDARPDLDRSTLTGYMNACLTAWEVSQKERGE